MARISAPQNPMTASNTDGYDAQQMAHLNAVYVQAWNELFGDENIDESDQCQIAKALWDAIGDTDGNVTLAVARMQKQI